MTGEERLELLKQIEKDIHVCSLESTFLEEAKSCAIHSAIEELEQEPRKGHWISHREHCEMNNLRPSGLGSYFWCSNCDCGIDSKNFARVNYNYCPNCGADMKEVTE